MTPAITPELRERAGKDRSIEWVEAQIGRELVGFQITAASILCRALGSPWNSPWNWRTVDWNVGGGVSVNMNAYGRGLATWDSDGLTRLVIAAHDACTRVCITPASPTYLKIRLHPRERDSSFMTGHPTIEEAIARFRPAPLDAPPASPLATGEAENPSPPTRLSAQALTIMGER